MVGLLQAGGGDCPHGGRRLKKGGGREEVCGAGGGEQKWGLLEGEGGWRW